ncbi:MAG: glycosyltransferase [Acidimicrobiales bacterium]
MTRISLNVIVYNEESRLEQCLADARPHVDEIVVVDQMSTDRTPEIAQRLADVFVRDVHHGHAEPSRQLAADRSSGDWLLILDADELMNDTLKSQLRHLVEGDADGYWIRKSNTIDGEETGTILHLRLVRRSRATFDPRPHGGANVPSGNVATFDEVGIIHDKTEEEQLYDDLRYEEMTREDDSPSSSKRNWLHHNRTLRAHRATTNRRDLEALLPADARRVAVIGSAVIEHHTAEVVELAATDLASAAGEGGTFDAVVASVDDADALDLSVLAAAVRPGGSVVVEVPSARNLRRLEHTVAATLGVEATTDLDESTGSTRRDLADRFAAVGLDVRWTSLRADGWLDPIALRADGRGSIVESGDFVLRDVRAEAAEEMTASSIVMVGERVDAPAGPRCSIVVAPSFDGEAAPVVEALLASTAGTHEILVVAPSADGVPDGARWVPAPEGSGLAARWNAGARASSGELVAFLAGGSVPEPGWLDVLVDARSCHAGVGAVGSRVLAADGTVLHAGLVIGVDAIPYRVHQGDSGSVPYVNRTRVVPAVSADGALLRRATFVEVGGFDESLGDDLADADLCLRLRSRGMPIVYSAAATVRSRPSTISGTRDRFRTSVKRFTTRWPAAARSNAVVCAIDGVEVNMSWNRSWRLPQPSQPAPDTSGAPSGLPAIAWSSHFYEHGGYTEEAITIVEALDDAGLHVVASPISYDRRWAPMPAHKAERLASLVARDLPDDFVHVQHIGANRFKHHPGALRTVGRTMYETDGLPAEWRRRCNEMDEIWVPCEHNRYSFARAGVDPSKLFVVPETFDNEMFDPARVTPLALPELDELDGDEGFVFLSVFSWLGRKAWDVLFEAWFEEFGRRDDVTLVVKTDLSLAPAGTDCVQEIHQFVRSRLGRDPRKGARVVVIDRLMDTADMPALYRRANAFVLPSHGEGWGRPYMEAMAMGLPTIATRWSGNLEFMDDDNSLLVDATLVDAPDTDWLRGQRWAQPSVSDLRRAMRRLADHPDEATDLGARARVDVLDRCSGQRVAEAVRERLEAIDRHPVHVSAAPATPALTQRLAPRAAPAGRRLHVGIVTSPAWPSAQQCIASLGDLADTVTVVEAGDDLAAARNEVLDRTGGGWVLMLDASHTLDPTSHDAVRQLMSQGGFVGYTAHEQRQTDFDGALDASEARRAVLFPHHPGLRFVGPVDGVLLPTSDTTGFRLVSSPIRVLQHLRRPDDHDPPARARRSLTALERAMRAEPDQPFHAVALGNALADVGLHDEAETLLRRAIAEGKASSAPWLASAHLSLSRVLTRQGRIADAVRSARKATKRAPDWAHAWCELSMTLLDAGRVDDALDALRDAVECDEGSVVMTDPMHDSSWQIHLALARVELASGDPGRASEHLTWALSRRPVDDHLRGLLAHAYDRLGWSAAARQQLEAAVASRTGAEAYLRLSDHFLTVAENTVVRGLADNPEHRELADRIHRIRSVHADRR